MSQAVPIEENHPPLGFVLAISSLVQRPHEILGGLPPPFQLAGLGLTASLRPSAAAKQLTRLRLSSRPPQSLPQPEFVEED